MEQLGHDNDLQLKHVQYLYVISPLRSDFAAVIILSIKNQLDHM